MRHLTGRSAYRHNQALHPIRRLFGPVREVLQSAGYDVVRAQSNKWLQRMGVRTVIDVGANTGQFARLARRTFPDAMIYSFEPIEKCYRQLLASFANDSRFQAFPWALGDQTGQASFHQSNYSPSSSVLPMAALHREQFPYTAKESVGLVEMRRLDDAARLLKLETPVLAKLDVQGYEDHVIKGGINVLRAATVLIIEVSFERLYAGQPLFHEIYELTSGMNFLYHGSWRQLLSPEDGRPLQADAVFIRS
jgi:FkbM family methyltransferase